MLVVNDSIHSNYDKLLALPQKNVMILSVLLDDLLL